MAGIFDDLIPQQQNEQDNLFADLVPKNYKQPPLPPARPSQGEILDALGITEQAPAKPVSIESALNGFDARLSPPSTSPAPVPDAGVFAPLPPRRPDALPEIAPLMPRRPD